MELKDTVVLMNSADFKERFKAEYYQLKNRYEGLHKMTVKYACGTLNFAPTCDLKLLEEQEAVMLEYLKILEIRAELEGIEL